MQSFFLLCALILHGAGFPYQNGLAASAHFVPDKNDSAMTLAEWLNELDGTALNASGHQSMPPYQYAHMPCDEWETPEASLLLDSSLNLGELNQAVLNMGAEGLQNHSEFMHARQYDHYYHFSVPTESFHSSASFVSSNHYQPTVLTTDHDLPAVQEELCVTEECSDVTVASAPDLLKNQFMLPSHDAHMHLAPFPCSSDQEMKLPDAIMQIVRQDVNARQQIFVRDETTIAEKTEYPSEEIRKCIFTTLKRTKCSLYDMKAEIETLMSSRKLAETPEDRSMQALLNVVYKMHRLQSAIVDTIKRYILRKKRQLSVSDPKEMGEDDYATFCYLIQTRRRGVADIHIKEDVSLDEMEAAIQDMQRYQMWAEQSRSAKTDDELQLLMHAIAQIKIEAQNNDITPAAQLDLECETLKNRQRTSIASAKKQRSKQRSTSQNPIDLVQSPASSDEVVRLGALIRARVMQFVSEGKKIFCRDETTMTAETKYPKKEISLWIITNLKGTNASLDDIESAIASIISSMQATEEDRQIYLELKGLQNAVSKMNKLQSSIVSTVRLYMGRKKSILTVKGATEMDLSQLDSTHKNLLRTRRLGIAGIHEKENASLEEIEAAIQDMQSSKMWAEQSQSAKMDAELQLLMCAIAHMKTKAGNKRIKSAEQLKLDCASMRNRKAKSLVRSNNKRSTNPGPPKVQAHK